MHLAAPDVGLMGQSSIVTSTIPHAVGAALAAKRLNKDQVIVSVFGDGAVDEGVYHESINFASLHKLPIIFLCENNGLAVHSSIEDRQAFKILEHVKAYGISTTYCPEGYDFEKVFTAFSGIVDHVRKNRLPHFIEINTFRYVEHVGHGEDYDDGYRARGELDAWKSRDSLILDTELVDKYTPIILKKIDEAVEFAEKNIQINALAPGFCKTSYFENFQENKELYDFTLSRTPMNRWGESKEIADVCVFLASSMSNYMTGEVLKVDGGWSAG